MLGAEQLFLLKRKMEPMALFFELIKSKVKPRPRHVAIVFTEKKQQLSHAMNSDTFALLSAGREF